MNIKQKLAYFSKYQGIIPGFSVQYLKPEKGCDGQFNFCDGGKTMFIVSKSYVEENSPGHVMNIVFSHIKNKLEIAPDVVVVDWDSPIQLSKPKTKHNFTRFNYLLWILPKSTRPEFISDITDLRAELNSKGCLKVEIVLAIILMLISVGYHLFIGKLSGYFYGSKAQVK